jgi:hypothetical protein
MLSATLAPVSPQHQTRRSLGTPALVLPGPSFLAMLRYLVALPEGGQGPGISGTRLGEAYMLILEHGLVQYGPRHCAQLPSLRCMLLAWCS